MRTRSQTGAMRVSEKRKRAIGGSAMTVPFPIRVLAISLGPPLLRANCAFEPKGETGPRGPKGTAVRSCRIGTCGPPDRVVGLREQRGRAGAAGGPACGDRPARHTQVLAV